MVLVGFVITLLVQGQSEIRGIREYVFTQEKAGGFTNVVCPPRIVPCACPEFIGGQKQTSFFRGGSIIRESPTVSRDGIDVLGKRFTVQLSRDLDCVGSDFCECICKFRRL